MDTSPGEIPRSNNLLTSPLTGSFLAFAFGITRAKVTKWTGHENYCIQNYCSIAQYSWLMSVLCLALPTRLGVDARRCAAMAVVYGISKTSLNQPLHPLAKELWEEFNKKESKESKILAEVEKITLLLIMLRFDEAGNHAEGLPDLSDIVENVAILKCDTDEILQGWLQSRGNNRTQPVDNSRRGNGTWPGGIDLESNPDLRSALYIRSNFATFAFIASQLLNRKRRIWTRHCKGELASVAEHSWMIAALLLALPEKQEVDITYCISMAGIHGMAKGLLGDAVPTDDACKPEDYLHECVTTELILCYLPGSWAMKLWEEFERGESLESRVVQNMGEIEMMVQGLYYENVSGYESDLLTFMGTGNRMEALRSLVTHVLQGWEGGWDVRIHKS